VTVSLQAEPASCCFANQPDLVRKLRRQPNSIATRRLGLGISSNPAKQPRAKATIYLADFPQYLIDTALQRYMSPRNTLKEKLVLVEEAYALGFVRQVAGRS
jgi:hypothetical protein